MKKIIIIGFCILTVSSILFFGCKKGPEDPWLSFRSRKTRVSGVWNVTAYTVNGIDSLARDTSYSVDSTSCGNYSFSKSVVGTFTWTFVNTGDYVIQSIFTTSESKIFDPKTSKCKSISTTYPATPPAEVKGIWDFAGGVGQFNTKEEIILTDPTDHVDDITYDMIKCSYKELILSQSVTNKTTGVVKIRQWTLSRQK